MIGLTYNKNHQELEELRKSITDTEIVDFITNQTYLLKEGRNKLENYVLEMSIDLSLDRTAFYDFRLVLSTIIAKWKLS